MRGRRLKQRTYLAGRREGGGYSRRKVSPKSRSTSPTAIAIATDGSSAFLLARKLSRNSHRRCHCHRCRCRRRYRCESKGFSYRHEGDGVERDGAREEKMKRERKEKERERETEFLEYSRNFNRKLIRGPRKREQWRSSLRDEMKGRNPESSSSNKQIRRLRIRGCYNAPGNHSSSLTHIPPPLSLLFVSLLSLFYLLRIYLLTISPRELSLNAHCEVLWINEENGVKAKAGGKIGFPGNARIILVNPV